MKCVLFLFLFIAQCSLSQTLVETTPLTANTFVGFDSFNNLYSINGMVLYKEGPLGTFEFTDFQLGNITSVDIINPLNIVVFYKDSNVVLLLDNRLNQIEYINFNTTQEFINVGAASNAGGNKLWIFDTDLQQLETYNYRTQQKIIISQPIAEKFINIASNFNYCYVLTNIGVQSFTLFGGIAETINFEDAVDIEQNNDALLLVRENVLFQLSESKIRKNKNASKEELHIETIKTPEISIQDLQLTRDFLYIYDGKNLHTFTINQPKK